jgi:hypothetical protein
MKTEAEINAYIEVLDRKDEQLENEVVKHQQLHQLYPDAGHQKSRELAERQLLAVRAKAAAMEWILGESGGLIPQD